MNACATIGNMTSIIRVKYIAKSEQDSADEELVDKEMLVNIDCPIRIILNYIQNVAGLDNTREFDLCEDTNYQLRNVGSFKPHVSGLDVLEPNLTYFIITYDRDENGHMTNFAPIITERTARGYSEILSKIRKSSRKNSSHKNSF